MLQEAPAAKAAAQVVVLEKSPVGADIVRPASATVFVFVSLSVCTVLELTSWLPNPRLFRDKAGPLKPVPVKVTVSGLLVAAAVIFSEAFRAPMAVGLNVTLTTQLPLAGTLAPHVLVCA
jgi:hypothetical protein